MQLVDGVFAAHKDPLAHDGVWGYLEFFSFFIAFIVMFRVFFSTLYVLKWNFFYSCTKSYAIKKQNLEKAFKKVKNEAAKSGDSTDDELFEENMLNKYKEVTQALGGDA